MGNYFEETGGSYEMAKKEKQPSEVLSAEDKLLVKSLEVDAYKAQAQYQQAQSEAQNAITALNTAIKSLADKYGRNLTEYALDLKSLEFVPRPQQEGK